MRHEKSRGREALMFPAVKVLFFSGAMLAHAVNGWSREAAPKRGTAVGTAVPANERETARLLRAPVGGAGSNLVERRVAD